MTIPVWSQAVWQRFPHDPAAEGADKVGWGACPVLLPLEEDGETRRFRHSHSTREEEVRSPPRSGH